MYYQFSQLEKYIRICSKQKRTFKVTKQKSSATIEFSNGKKVKFMENLYAANKMPGLFLIERVRKQVEKKIKLGDIPNSTIGPPPIYVNPDGIAPLLGKKLVGVDINACYWKTAYMLGVIDQKLYEQGMSKSSYKGARLVAIGCLMKHVEHLEFQNGVLTQRYETTGHGPYTDRFYWQIINHVRGVCNDFAAEYGDQCAMWYVDCAMVAPEREAEVRGWIEGRGYKTKTINVEFTSYNRPYLHWVVDKDGKKKYLPLSAPQAQRLAELIGDDYGKKRRQLDSEGTQPTEERGVA